MSKYIASHLPSQFVALARLSIAPSVYLLGQVTMPKHYCLKPKLIILNVTKIQIFMSQD